MYKKTFRWQRKKSNCVCLLVTEEMRLLSWGVDSIRTDLRS